MKSAVETLSPTRVRLTVEVPYEELEPSLKNAYKRIAAQVTVPGFRKGKVPAAIIDQRFGRGVVLDEAINEVLPKAYDDAIAENDLKPLAQPEVDIEPIEDPNAREPLKFTAEVDVRPEITLPELEGIELQVADAEVDEADVTKELDALRSRFGTLKPLDRPVQSGDFITVDLSATSEGESIEDATASDLSYEVGGTELIEGIDEAVLGLEAGGSSSFVSQAFQGAYEGKDVEVTVTVKSVKERELPVADDDFAQMASEFDTLDELTGALREQLGEFSKVQQGVEARDKLVEHLLTVVDIPIPENVVQADIEDHFKDGHGDDAHRTEYESGVERSLKSQLLLDEIANKEQVAVSEAELVDFLVRQASQYGMGPDQFVEQVVRSGQTGSFVGEVRRGKALAGVLEKAVVTDASGRPVDLKALTQSTELIPDSDSEVHDDDDHEGHDHD